jgi:hypothetical protein
MLLYLALVCVVLVLSTFYVLRLGRSSADPSSAAPPPRVPYWLPFVGNALAFGRDSQGYLQRCQQQYGDAFRLKMMGQDYVFVLDPFSFPNVFREEKKNLSFIAIVKEFACKCFGASEDEFEKQNHETVHKLVIPSPKSLFVGQFFLVLLVYALSSFVFLSLSFFRSFLAVSVCRETRTYIAGISLTRSVPLSFLPFTGNSSHTSRVSSCPPSRPACATTSSGPLKKRPSRNCRDRPEPNGSTARCGTSSWKYSTWPVR